MFVHFRTSNSSYFLRLLFLTVHQEQHPSIPSIHINGHGRSSQLLFWLIFQQYSRNFCSAMLPYNWLKMWPTLSSYQYPQKWTSLTPSVLLLLRGPLSYPSPWDYTITTRVFHTWYCWGKILIVVLLVFLLLFFLRFLALGLVLVLCNSVLMVLVGRRFSWLWSSGDVVVRTICVQIVDVVVVFMFLPEITLVLSWVFCVGVIMWYGGRWNGSSQSG